MPLNAYTVCHSLQLLHIAYFASLEMHPEKTLIHWTWAEGETQNVLGSALKA